MHLFSQTNIQLFNQLQQKGYRQDEMQRVSQGYTLAISLFTGRFRGSGKTFIAHLIGTASILTWLQVSSEIITAGLLHATYQQGDFGSFKKYGISDSKRKQVRRIVGEKTEEYIAKYAQLSWKKAQLNHIYEQIDTMNNIGKNVLLIRLANELEEYLDQGIVYCNQSKQQDYDLRNQDTIIKMAQKLGYPSLAEQLEKSFKMISAADISLELRNPSHQEYSFVLAPQSYRQKWFISLAQKLNR